MYYYCWQIINSTERLVKVKWKRSSLPAVPRLVHYLTKRKLVQLKYNDQNKVTEDALAYFCLAAPIKLCYIYIYIYAMFKFWTFTILITIINFQLVVLRLLVNLSCNPNNLGILLKFKVSGELSHPSTCRIVNLFSPLTLLYHI